MRRSFTLEYWMDEDCYVGRLGEIPGIFSQGESVEELEENVRDAYQLSVEGQPEGWPWEASGIYLTFDLVLVD